MRLMASFFRKYPAQTLLMLLALLLSGVAEGIGLSALLPLLNIAMGADRSYTMTGEAAGIQNEFEQRVVEALLAIGIEPTLGSLLLIVVVGVCLKSLLLLAAQRQVGYTAAQVGTDLRLQMLRAILRSKWEYFLHQPVGKLTNSLATEAQRSSDSFVFGAQALAFLIEAIIYGLVALAISWQAVVTSLAAGAVVIGGSHFLVRMSRRAGKKQTNLMTSLIARLTDTLQSVKPLKAMAREHLADSVLALETAQLNKSLRKQVFSAAMLNSAQELMFAIFICIGIYLALAVFRIDFATVMVLVVTVGRSFSFLGKVQKQYQKLVQGESAYWSMQSSIEAAEAAEERLGTGLEPMFRDCIAFEQVAFSYDQHPVLNDLSLRFPARTLTTLIGPSGSGKTTIIDLTIGLLRPGHGTVSIDGASLGDLDIKAWRRKIGYVPQDTVLLHDSILHNVTLGDAEVSQADAEQALRAAGAWEFVSQQPHGILTVVGERGGKLSGGQRQRIAIARALVNRPELLILDEATSALDPASEQEIRNTMESLKGQLTILAISHNTALVDAADQVYRLEYGRAVLVSDSARGTTAGRVE